jgi:hypothetical protein
LTTIQKINFILIAVVFAILALNFVLQITIIRNQRKTIDLQIDTIRHWQARAYACEAAAQIVNTGNTDESNEPSAE